MSATSSDALEVVRQAIEQGQHGRARRLLRDVLQHDPHNYRAWLWLAGITESAVASLEYVRRAHQLNPDDPIVQHALQWAEERNATLHPAPAGEETRPLATAPISEAPMRTPVTPAPTPAPVAPPPAPEAESAPAEIAAPSWRRRLAIILVVVVLIWLLVLALNRARLQSRGPATLVIQAGLAAEQAGAGLLAIAEQASASASVAAAPDGYAPQTAPATQLTPEPGTTTAEEAAQSTQRPADSQRADMEASGLAPQVRRGKLAVRSELPRPTWTPTPTATPLPSPTPLPTATPEPAPAFAANEARWIDVNLTTQTLTAYEYDQLVYTALVSSGTWLHPTVEGQFRIYLRYEAQNMSGYHLGFDYYLPNVPYVMYFFENYALHGAYWHNNFGTPMSHGCVNLDLGTAEWLYNFATEGTLVNVHY